MSVFQQRGEKSQVIASADTWLEGDALRQLDTVATWNGMRQCIGMPDLHPGKGSPVGAAFAADVIFPTLVGSDIGCGMALYTTDFKAYKAKPAKLADALDGLDRPWDGDTAEFLNSRNVASTPYDLSLGTPGHSNHFIEVQKVIETRDPVLAESLGLRTDNLCVLIHSGSRGFGEAILYDVAQKQGANGLMCDSPDGVAYLAAHDHAVRWAVANRDLCAQRALDAIGADGQRIVDICHNSVQAYSLDGCACWLHRKGAAPTTDGAVVIPGSRGDVSYLVQTKPTASSLHSIAHGAGRKIARGEAKGKLEHRYRISELQQNRWGGRVVCGERQLLWEEAPDCYKDVNTVVNDLVAADLVSVIAVLCPLVTFKTSEGARVETRNTKEARERERASARAAKGRR